MDTVWIVTSGDYSDYHINAVFATEDDAKAWIGPYPDAYMLKEWPLGGKRATPVGMAAYQVAMWHDGTVEYAEISESDEDSAQRHETYLGRRHSLSPPYGPTEEGLYLCAKMFARDRQHAIKIANERRAYLIATEQWNDGTYTDAVAALQAE